MREDVLKKADKFCKTIKKELDIDNDEVIRIVSKLVNGFHNKRKSKAVLSRKEAAVYELLLNKGYNPNTVYRWLLAADSPVEIVNRLRSGEISIREALNMRHRIRQQFSTNDEQIIKEIIWYVEEYIQ